jgi:acyl-CoA thioester hydrolase
MIATNYSEHRERVRPEWVDPAGELAPAFAVVIFDHAIDLLYDGIGIGDAYRQVTDFSTFTLETHSLHEQPVPADEEVLVRSHILAVDAKRMHIAQEMFRPGQTRRAALMEQLSIHIDLSIRRSAPFPPERLSEIRAAMEAQREWPRPRGTGRRITLATH